MFPAFTDPSLQCSSATTLQYVLLSSCPATNKLMLQSRHIPHTHLAFWNMLLNIQSPCSRRNITWLLRLHFPASVPELLKWHSEVCVLTLLTPCLKTCMSHQLILHSGACISSSPSPCSRSSLAATDPWSTESMPHIQKLLQKTLVKSPELSL